MSSRSTYWHLLLLICFWVPYKLLHMSSHETELWLTFMFGTKCKRVSYFRYPIYTGHFLAHDSYRYTFSALNFTLATFQHSTCSMSTQKKTYHYPANTHSWLVIFRHSISAPVVSNTILIRLYFSICQTHFRLPILFPFFDTQCLCVSILTPTFFFWAHPDHYLPVFFVINHISLMCLHGYPISNGIIFRSLTYWCHGFHQIFSWNCWSQKCLFASV